jgi:protein disulfide-isomerase A6
VLALVAVVAQGAPFADGFGNVQALTAKTFDAKVLKGSELWMIQFYAPWCGHCVGCAEAFVGSSKELKASHPQVKFGAVDCTEPSNEKDVCANYNIRGFPTVKVFGKDKKDPEDYGGAREVAAMVTYMKDNSAGFSSGGGGTQSLTYLKTYTWLNGGKEPRVLLFGKKASVKDAPEWLGSVAGEFDKKAVFGFAPAAEDKIAGRFLFKKLPQLVLMFPSGKYATHKGKISEQEVKDFVSKTLKLSKKEKKALPATPSFPAPSVPRKKQGRAMSQLTAANANDKCFKLSGKKNICVLLVLTAEQEELEHDQQQLLKDIAGKYRNDPLQFVWVASADGAAVKEAFGLDDEGGPHMVALKTGKRNRFAKHGGEADSDGVSNFLDNILGGGVQMKAIKKLPSLTAEE